MSAAEKLEAQPRERGILFKGFLVKKILAGQKWQTRRICGLDIPADADEVFFWDEPEKRRQWGGCNSMAAAGVYARRNDDEGGYIRYVGPSPYGSPGDRLWVKETFLYIDRDKRLVDYRATTEDGPGRWCPSIFMPRWASRITLELTGVRVERAQDISCADIRAEGFDCPACGPDPTCGCDALRKGFREGWDRINGQRPGGAWKLNPWVWVLEWKPLKGVQP